jgi:sugar diacid utilization regulator
LRRIEQITALDLGSLRDLACVHVAMQTRDGSRR